jgi:aminoglycoside phosphotransferase (APT) family kinase protein
MAAAEEVALAAALEEALAEPLGEVRVEEIRPLAGGASREMLAFDAVGEAGTVPLVLARPASGPGRDPDLGLERAMLAAADSAGVPVPRPYAMLAAGAHGGAGLVVERLEGEALPSRLLRDERFAAARERLVGQTATALARLHALPPEAAGLTAERPPDDDRPATAGPNDDAGTVAADLSADAPTAANRGADARRNDDGRTTDDGRTAAERALDQVEAMIDAVGEPHPALEAGLRWLRLNPPAAERGPVLVHGDCRLGNLLVDEDGLVALLDWELAHAGDPAEDLGWICARSWRFGNDDRPALGLGSREELLRAYAEAGGAPIGREELRWWEALANARWAGLCLVQTARFLADPATAPLELGAVGRRAAEAEWDLLALVA